MNAQQKNLSETLLFERGGRLDILLWGYQELERQAEEGRREHKVLFGGGKLELIEECPCGCGLKNDICEARRLAMDVINGEIPF